VLHHKHHHHAYHLQKSFLTPIINMFCFQNGLKHTIMVKKCCNKFFEIVWLSTFSNPMFKKCCHKLYSNKVVQLSNNAIVKRNYIFWLILNTFVKN
jgi:hypothetical protein